MTVMMKRTSAVIFFVLTLTVISSAQTSNAQTPSSQTALTSSNPTAAASSQRAPSAAIRPYIVLEAQSLNDLEKKLRPDNKVEDLIGGAGMQLRVAVQHDKTRPTATAELHDASDDVYYVLAGTAMLTLGGKLDAPREAEPGEWRSPRIIGGQIFELKQGDLIVVPRGTPHQRISPAGKEFSMILIKVFAQPLPAPQPKPAMTGKEQKP